MLPECRSLCSFCDAEDPDVVTDSGLFLCQNCLSAYAAGQDEPHVEYHDVDSAREESRQSCCQSYVDKCPCPFCHEYTTTCSECFKTAKCGESWLTEVQVESTQEICTKPDWDEW